MARLLTSPRSEKEEGGRQVERKMKVVRSEKGIRSTINMEAALSRGFLDSHFGSLVNPPEN